MLSFNSYGEWTKVNMDVIGDSYYIDFSTVKVVGDYVNWWEMRDFIEPDDEGSMSVMYYIKGDCENTRTKFKSVLDYEGSMGTGDSTDMSGGVLNLEEIMEWRYPPPPSVDYANLTDVCSLAEVYSDSDYEDVVEEIIDYFESIDWGDVETTSESTNFELTEQQQNLQSGWVEDISAEVKSNWRYQGADDDWWCEVYVLQKRNGEVELVDIQRCQNIPSNQEEAFKGSLTRAVYKSSPLPPAPNYAVFEAHINLIFRN